MSLVFVSNTWDQELFAQDVIPPKHTDTKNLSLENYELKDVMLGSPTQDST